MCCKCIYIELKVLCKLGKIKWTKTLQIKKSFFVVYEWYHLFASDIGSLICSIIMLYQLELNQPRKTLIAMKIVTGYIEITHTNSCRLIKITHVPFWFLLFLILIIFLLCLYDAEAKVNIMLLYICRWLLR